MKTIWAVLLGLALLAVPTVGQAQSGSGSNFVYSINASNSATITVTNYTGASGVVSIPTNINGHLVTGIGNGTNSVFDGILTNVTIPSSVTTIGAYAFSVCTNLTNVTIPTSVTTIGAGPFSICTKLTNITVTQPNSFYSSSNGVLFDAAKKTLIQYPGGLSGSYTIPSTVTSLGVSSFYYCWYLSGVTIPSGVTTIPQFAFSGCTNLGSITIPSGVTNIAEAAFYLCYTLSNISLPSGLTSVDLYAFDSCTSLRQIALPGSLNNIGQFAFEYCVDLSSITIPTGVTSVQDYTFSGCSALTNVALPNTVTNIAQFAFSYCSSLPYIAIPASVTSIGTAAFVNCSSLAGVYFAGNAPSASVNIFAGDSASQLTSYYLAGTTGWSHGFWGYPTSGGPPANLWSAAIQTSDANFGVQNGVFGFDVTGPTNVAAVVVVSTDLSNPAWTPLRTVIATNGVGYFTDPQWNNYTTRYYRLEYP